MADWVALAALLLRLFFVIWDKMKKQTPEQRKRNLAELDAAMLLATEKKDLREMSKWFGRRL
jgi:hypothetical protein